MNSVKIKVMPGQFGSLVYIDGQEVKELVGFKLHHEVDSICVLELKVLCGEVEVEGEIDPLGLRVEHIKP